MKILIVLMLASTFAPGFSQGPRLGSDVKSPLDAKWLRFEKTDPFSGARYTQFILTGRFLQAPRDGDLDYPALQINCKARQHNIGHRLTVGGDLLSARLDLGAVIDRTPTGVPAMYRLDDGKAQTEFWSISTDGTTAFFEDITLDNMLFGHMLLHKENTNPPVSKVVIAVDEALGGRIVMQFDMPDPTDIAETCGIISHRR